MSKKNEVVEWYVSEKPEDKCAACGSAKNLSVHHLRPQVCCKNKYKKLKDEETNHVILCRQCHDAVHAAYSEQELRDNYDTLEKLLAAPEFAKFVSWKKKHPDFDGHAKMSKERKEKKCR